MAARRLLPLLALAALALAGCPEDERAFARFDGPMDTAVMPPGELFEVPVALVTNFRSGRVSKLDLKRTSVLVEDSVAPWMPGPDLAFGANRALSEIVVVAGDDFVDVWVADDFRDELLRGPWIDGLDADGKPNWVRPSVSGVTFRNKDGDVVEGATVPSLRSLRARHDRATTESWTMTWTGHSFEVEGTAAGVQRLPAIPGTPYETDQGELAFVVALNSYAPTLGDRLELETFSGIEAADAGGLITDLLLEPSGTWVFATVVPDDGPGFVSVWDAATFAELDRLDLPLGAAPERLEGGADDGVVWVADSFEEADGSGRLFRLDFVPGDVDTLAATELHAPEPLIDVAQSRAAQRWLFAAAAYSDAVWTLDPLTGQPFDINPITPEVEATRVGSIVSGLASTANPVESVQLDQDGSRFAVHSIFVTTFEGEGYLLDGETGCQMFGTPARSFSSTSCSDSFSDIGFESDPLIAFDEAGERCVTTHPCGGVSKSETWTLTFDVDSQSYEVEGSRSGVQVNPAFEGVRYTSDEGAISLLVMPGALPTSDGDRWIFTIDDGVTPVSLQELPGDPVIYTELYDDRTGSWFEVKEREVGVIPHAGNDVVLWVDLQGQGQGGGGMRAWQ